MKRTVVGTVFISLVFCLFVGPPVAALAADTPHVLIVGVQTESSSSASEEFVELYNPGDQTVDVTGWKLQYRSASAEGATGWITKATFGCGADCKVSMPAASKLLAATYSAANDTGQISQKLVSGMATTGGEVRLMQPDTDDPQDMLGYGAAKTAEGDHPAVAPKKGQTLKRKVADDGTYIDTDDNLNDFFADPSVDQNDQTDDNTQTADEDTAGKGGSTETKTYLSIDITELLPDPVAPQQDSTDEFVELYNPNDTAVNLKDYILQAGTDWRYKFVLPDIVLAPKSYYAFTAADTHLVLSNSGSNVQLLDPTGKVISQVQYGVAKAGESWTRADTGEWGWSLTPTPGSSNRIVVAEQEPSVVKAKIATAAVRKTTAKTASTSKPKSTAAKTAAKPKASAKSTAKQTGQTLGAATQKSQPNYWLVAGVLAVAGGYGVYEYRRDVAGGIRRAYEFVRSKGK